MKISLNEIKKYVQIPADISDQDLITLIGSRLVEIEEAIPLAPKYQGIYIVKVVKAEPIPGTHLNLCQIDAGPHNSEFNQLENGLVQVVCGAPNVHSGMFAVWITPGSIVPSTYGNENFKLSVRKLQGYESNGMLAGADELDFATEHKAIAEISPKLAQPGDSLIDVFELDDIILDVENKSLTHRPDCFGLIGFAREVAGILGIEFQEPIWPELAQSSELPISVKITDSELCPRYSCAVFDLPKYGSDHYLTYYGDVFLAKAGMRAINPMVDLTNMIMLRTGQPLHAFDYDKLIQVGGTETPEIIVRAAREGESLQLLDGKTITCIPEDILITSNNVPVALAGAMGGKNTEIDAFTQRVVLESATFSLYHLRKTQMAHGIFSEAITRFTKGQPAAMTYPVLAETVAELDSQLKVLATVDEWVADRQQNVVKLTTSELNQLLGTDYSAKVITKTLTNVGFQVELERSDKASTMLKVTAPIWRTDIHIKEDIIEEVGRLLGYDNIPLGLPTGKFTGTEISPMIRLKDELRNILSDKLNMHELLTYSFVSKALLEKVGLDPADSYEIVNSISPDLQCFRPQLVPSLLDKIRENVKSGHQNFTLYELNQVSAKSGGLDADQVPVVQTDLGIVHLGDFYELKCLVIGFMERHGLKHDIEYRRLSLGSNLAKQYPYLEPVRSAEILIHDQPIGVFGEVKSAVLRKFKCEAPISACEINLDQLVDLPRNLDISVQLSRFPSVERDLTLKVAADMPFGRVSNLIHDILSQEELIYTVTPASIYQVDPVTKNLSFHLRFASRSHTLDSAQISAIIEKITTAATHIGATSI